MSSAFSAARIVALRKSQGLSQEALAEGSGVSLRTIQRVEQGATLPHGHTLRALATALGVPLAALHAAPEATTAPQLPPAVPPVLRPDPAFLQLLNLSALSFLLLPLLNVLVLLLWRARRHDTAHVAELGRRVLGFQILWQVGCFFAYLLLIAAQLVAARYYRVVVPGAFVGLLGLTYALNVLTVGYYARRLRQGDLDVYPIRL